MLNASTREHIRDLARRYVEVCNTDRNAEARRLWRDHNSLRPTRPPVICSWYWASCLHEEIGGDYVVSWRPSPAMVSAGFDAEAIRKAVREGFCAARANGCSVEIMLKEMMTVEGDLSRLFRWTQIAVEESERGGGR